ncbi:hypothetical protein P700755_002773 [Psychroflexus torquis ATCC 700755]|uniref:Lipoprotein n=1 Tax=Psychroflexus torquis (strain ATCC 700755 / CIP 106069 / ACAM 623) TaxID=313595 RepID=K4IVN4_PSYTT|nr:hypothetical protein [Psychroflexus torquis]AFU69500.1 hypothetical protein P700755_002773 [Psychroflexus torquis ATCC 700755]
MRTINFILLIMILISGCSEKKDSNTVSTNRATKEVSIKLPKKDSIITATNQFIIVSHNYDFEKDYYGIIINEFTLKGTSLESTKDYVSFGKFKDVLMGGKYNTSGANYPVQLNLAKTKVYLSIYSADEMEGTFDYNKILEYDMENDSVREIYSFSDYFSSWYLSESNNKIYGFDYTSKSLVSIDTENSNLDTLYSSTTSFEEIEYHLRSNGALDIITFDRDNGVTKFNVNLKTNELIITALLPLNSFSSYKSGFIVETFKDFKNDIEELRIYNGSNKRSIPFDFENFKTFWINDSEFIVIKENLIQKINTDLEIMNEFTSKDIHVIDVTSKSIIISYTENSIKKAGFLDLDFNNLVEISSVEPNKIVLIKDK